MADDAPVLRLETWDGDWPDDDPDANFRTDVATYSKLDPLQTLRPMSEGLDIPVGALARYVLARWATGGSEGLLELGPSTVRRMHDKIAAAEEAGTDEARLAAYEELKAMVGWLAAGS